MPMGAVLLEFDMKMGPVFKFAVPTTLEVTPDETLVLFGTRSVVEEGFTGISIKNRTWATYLNPPYLFCVLLTPMEHQNDFEEAMETTKIFSVVGLLSRGQALVTSRPFRSPHHTISDAGLIGGGHVPKPGEVRRHLTLSELRNAQNRLVQWLKEM